MNLAEKIKHLREVEGELRGLGRPMTQMEVVKAMQEEMNETLSQAYLSQLENGKRLHLTATSRDLLARFFKVQPGYLVSDLPDYSTDLLTDIESETDRLNTWLIASAEEWSAEPLLAEFFERLASSEDPRAYIELFKRLVDLPVESVKKLVNALLPKNNDAAWVGIVVGRCVYIFRKIFAIRKLKEQMHDPENTPLFSLYTQESLAAKPLYTAAQQVAATESSSGAGMLFRWRAITAGTQFLRQLFLSCTGAHGYSAWNVVLLSGYRIRHRWHSYQHYRRH